MLRKTSNYLPLIIALALGLRLVGIVHGFPFIFHPDEPTIVRSALGLRFDLNPGHFDWPHLYIYLNYLVYMVFAKLRELISLFGYKEYTYFIWPLLWDDELIFYLLTRMFSAVLGALSVIPVYLTGAKLFGRRAGWFSALVLAVAPYHVWHSHYSLPDVPMMFFLAWGLYFTSNIVFKSKLKYYLWSGLCIGLAASTKYNAALLLAGLILAHLIRVFSEKNEKLLDFDSWKNLILAGLMSATGFVLGTPFAILDYQTFIRTDSAKGALWQFTNVGDTSWAEHLKQFIDVLVVGLPENLGYTPMILFAAAAAYLVYRLAKYKTLRENKDLLFFVILGLGLIFHVSGLEKTRAHYFFIAYPAIILAGIGFLTQRLDRLNSRYNWLFLVAVVAVPLFFALRSAYTFYQTDTRVMLYRWFLENKADLAQVYLADKDLEPLAQKAEVRFVQAETRIGQLSPGSVLVTTSGEQNRLKLIQKFAPYINKGPDIYIYAP